MDNRQTRNTRLFTAATRIMDRIMILHTDRSVSADQHAAMRTDYFVTYACTLYVTFTIFAWLCR